jgi:hypothetical protein
VSTPVVALLLAAATACGSTVQSHGAQSAGELNGSVSDRSAAGAGAVGSNAEGASSSDISAGGATASRARSGASGGAAATSGAAAVKGPVSTKPIKIGYTVADVAGIAAGLGVAGYDPQEQTRATRDEWKALINYANSHGGVGGRKITGQEYVVTGTTDANALCVRATEDDHVEAMLDFDAFTADQDLACFAKHKTPLITQLFSPSRELVNQFRPYLATTFALPDRAESGLIDGLDRAGYFKGAKLGVIMDDLPLIKRIWAQKMQPALDRLGVKVLATHYFAPTDPGQQAPAAQSAVLDFQTKGVTHVISAANVLVLIMFSQAEQNAGYFPRLGLGDYFIGASAAPGNAQYFPSLARAMRDAVAVSVSGVIIDDPAKKKGSVIDRNNPALYPGTRRCLDVLSAELKTDYYKLDNNSRGRGWGAICDSFFLWWETAQKTGASYTPQSWGIPLPQLGTSFQSAVVHSTMFTPTQYDGAADYRVGVYWDSDTACACYKAALKDYFPLPTG